MAARCAAHPGTIAGGTPDGFLVRMGAGNGFEWGGQLLLPRKAWELAAVARLSAGRWRVEGFWLRPNELPSGDTRTELAGLKVEGSWSGGRSRAGAVFLGVPRSEQIYPRADQPGDFYLGDRDGLRALHLYGYVTPLPARAPTLTARVEVVGQRNPRIDMRAGALYAEAAYVFTKVRWTPTLSYTYAAFSGDDPGTSRYERFDPLFYGGSLYGTWFGGNSAWALLNSNFRVHRVSAQLVATQADFVTVQYNGFRVSELRSSVQFGQATRVRCGEGGCGLLTGVVEPELSQDLYGGWTHVFGPRVNVTVFGVTSVPDKVHIDGVNNLAHWTSGAPSARNVVYYYNESALTAIRIGPWKSHTQVRDGFFDYLRPSALIFNLRMDPFEQHGGQKADDIAMRLGVAWGGQVQDAVGALMKSLEQFPPRQKGGTLRMAGDR